ncbi:MAG: NADP-dependent oxidoreductase [Pseudomonadota bacterium]
MQQIVLKNHCHGLPEISDFELQNRSMPTPRPGEFLVRHIWCSVDPGTRSRLSGDDTYAPALPIGSPIDGFSVGIVEASRHDQFVEGMNVAVAGGWRTHSIQSGNGFVVPIPSSAQAIPLSYWIGVLGVPGLTAWFGLKKTANVQPGDSVLITSAAGPVGATAGQIAKAAGASRVVGIAGSDEKCDWLTKDVGFDAAINYKTAQDLSAAIVAECSDGIDVLFDNVGNEMINRVIPLMKLNGRICISGQVADYSVPVQERFGIQNTSQFITHRLNMRGLVVFDFASEFAAALAELSSLVIEGKLRVKEERITGIERMPEAFCGLFRGENFGRRVVKVGDAV